MHAEMMAYIMCVTVTLTVISYNSVFPQNTIDPEVSKTCASNNGLCGREIQQIYHVITHLKDKINILELKEDERQREIKDLKNKNNSFEGNILLLFYSVCLDYVHSRTSNQLKKVSNLFKQDVQM